MDKTENAVMFKHNGYNCCQAVLAAYKDEIGLNDDTARKLGAGFGAGMGGMEGTCGALCGAEIVLGLSGNTDVPVMKQAKNIHASFKKKCGATICKDLKKMTDGKPLCSCDDCVRNAVSVIEENKAAR